MASLLPEIPLRFMKSTEKYALINWLVDLGLPGRISAEVLRQWGEAVGVKLNATDYDMVYLGMNVVKKLPPGQMVS